jgi:hypothetical protein
MKYGRSKLLLLAVAALAIGAGAGFFAGLSVADGSRAWQASVASRYARDMFCYAPANRGRQVLSDYQKQLESRRDDDDFLWKREYSVVLASAAVLDEKAGKTAEWQRALAACQESGAKTCTESRLREEANRTCQVNPAAER